MTTNDKKTEQEYHRKFAVDLFNRTWDLLDKEDRTPEEADTMIHAAHASRFHWGEIGTPLEYARGEWQISRVYASLNRPQAALYHAQRSLDLCQANAIGDFDLAFAYEALARAYAIAGELDKSGEYIELAMRAAEQIEDAGNREYLEGELVTVSGCADSCSL
jgi:tetratricopeptide (TPR) repeat protein